MRLRVPKPNKLLPPTHIRIEFCMKYQISGFLTGTQILASLSPPGLFTALTEQKITDLLLWGIKTQKVCEEGNCSLKMALCLLTVSPSSKLGMGRLGIT